MCLMGVRVESLGQRVGSGGSQDPDFFCSDSCNLLTFECNLLLMNRIWQKRWDGTSMISSQKDRLLAYLPSLGCSLAHSDGSSCHIVSCLVERPTQPGHRDASGRPSERKWGSPPSILKGMESQQSCK